jgi:3-isopropylmalate/(R)-2-methylmalate dehydratase large subunit
MFGAVPRDPVKLEGRVLYLTDDVAWVRRQLAGETLQWPVEQALRAAISTDEITPGWVCFHYDETLGRYCLIGLAGEAISRTPSRRGLRRDRQRAQQGLRQLARDGALQRAGRG